jgi:hypothetical protein
MILKTEKKTKINIIYIQPCVHLDDNWKKTLVSFRFLFRVNQYLEQRKRD